MNAVELAAWVFVSAIWLGFGLWTGRIFNLLYQGGWILGRRDDPILYWLNAFLAGFLLLVSSALLVERMG